MFYLGLRSRIFRTSYSRSGLETLTGSISRNWNYLIFKNIKLKNTTISINKKNLPVPTNYLPFSISYYSPTVHTVQNFWPKIKKWNFYLSALLFFVGSGSGTIIPDPCKSSGFIGIRNTALIYSRCKKQCCKLPIPLQLPFNGDKRELGFVQKVMFAYCLDVWNTLFRRKKAFKCCLCSYDVIDHRTSVTS